MFRQHFRIQFQRPKGCWTYAGPIFQTEKAGVAALNKARNQFKGIGWSHRLVRITEESIEP